MCFGIRISSPFHLATQIVSIQNLNCPKTLKSHARTWFLSPFYKVKLCRLCWLQVNKEVAQSVFCWFIQHDVGRWYKLILFITESRIEDLLLRRQVKKTTGMNSFKHCKIWWINFSAWKSLLKVATLVYFSEKTFYENGRRWISMLNKCHSHGREFCKYGREFCKYGKGRALHMYGTSFQKSCLRMRF